jgi:energy-coupling factor transporter ATP-binding protein EcfA2
MNESIFLAAFNAKTMTFDEVASSFSPSKKYEELAGGWNALLIGPRGSGKTTLMKMLSLQGLRAWPTSELSSRPEITYTGIFVPADIAWSEMVRSLTIDVLDPRLGELVAEAACVINVLLSTARTIELRASQSQSASEFQSVSLLGSAHDEWVVHAAELWGVKLQSLSLRALTRALEARLIGLRQEVRFISLQQKQFDESQLRDRIPYLGLPLIESVSQALISFNQAVGEADHKWALLLDEFEVAPLTLQSTVLRALRGGSPELLLKVALAPCGPHTSLAEDPITGPTNRNDFRQVLLWYPDRGEAEKFCEDVCRGWLAKKAPDYASLPLKTVFGASSIAIVEDDDFDYDKNEDSSTRQKRLQDISKLFLALAAKDQSFQEFLIRRNIDPSNLAASDDSYARATIRKITPIVAFRNAYRSSSPIGKKKGRRPYVAAYIGWESIAAMSEGNPRWLIGMLISIWTSRYKKSELPISMAAQSDATRETGGTFVEILRSIATRPALGTNIGEPVLTIVEKLAEYFHDRLVKDSFAEDPHMVFEVDAATSPAVEESLRLALNHGAIICFEGPDKSGGYDSLQGRHFRLAYLLAQQFKLPIRKSKSISLSTALRINKPAQPSLSKSPLLRLNTPVALPRELGAWPTIQDKLPW